METRANIVDEAANFESKKLLKLAQSDFAPAQVIWLDGRYWQ
ncbi:MAG TPA: hypothetical protein VE732_08805 [Nitrososphaera sp.]|nr:hypothetical protein [Nitrososphaera sp.]